MFTYAPIPTTDLYFLNACAHMVSKPWRSGPIERLGANTFRSGDKYLVVRRDREAVIKRVLSHQQKGGEVIYLIDDDLTAIGDETLPSGYRERLETLKNGTYAAMMACATHIVTSSPVIAEKLETEAKVHVLSPVWSGAPRTEAQPANLGGVTDLVHLGTGSHGAGFEFLRPVIGATLKRFPNVHFHYFGNEPLMGHLDEHPHVHRRKLKTWAGYKRAMPSFRFHLGLYPLINTPFNAARSVNKILEYTLAGCPAMYSAEWGKAHGLVHGDNAFLAEDAAADWQARLVKILSAPGQMAKVYGGAKRYFEEKNDVAVQQAFWQEIFIRKQG
ncbi:hypothetical protein [Kordiimonas sp.]|uniref:hypothetical protein n=1 Tax=Kordiimonas sp. TaxID=1970157 RepID=UPI003A8D858B